MADGLPNAKDLGELAALARREPQLYVRWSRGPEEDLTGDESRDELTGVPLPGLSASPLAVEDWWGDRPLRLWLARRIYDYSHLRADKGPGVRPWVLVGRESGRGPDNEPLVRDVRPVAWLDEAVIGESAQEVRRQHSAWGSLRRRSDAGAEGGGYQAGGDSEGAEDGGDGPEGGGRDARGSGGAGGARGGGGDGRFGGSRAR